MPTTALRSIRQSRGLTQGQLADELECSPASIGFYETGVVTRPHRSSCTRLERFFGVPVIELLRPENGEGPDVENAEAHEPTSPNGSSSE